MVVVSHFMVGVGGEVKREKEVYLPKSERKEELYIRLRGKGRKRCFCSRLQGANYCIVYLLDYFAICALG